MGWHCRGIFKPPRRKQYQIAAGNPNWYKFIACWVMHGYLQEWFDYTPIIHFYAIRSRGKTRTCKGIIKVAYRGVPLISINEAQLFRIADNEQGTMWFDISNLESLLESNPGTRELLLGRFERGIKISRVIDASGKPFEDLRYYDFFGPTVLATNCDLDDTMTSRAVQIIMKKASRQYNDDIDENLALDFIERLNAFRARWIDKEKIQVTKPAVDRMGDIMRPIAVILKMIGVDDVWFRELLVSVTETDDNVKSDTREAKCLRALCNCMSSVAKTRIECREIAAVYNGLFCQDLPEKYHIKTNGVKKTFKELGFDVRNGDSGVPGVKIDIDLLQKSLTDYGMRITLRHSNSENAAKVDNQLFGGLSVI